LRNRPEVIDSCGVIALRDQGDETVVDCLKIKLPQKEFITEIIDIFFDDVPTLFEEETIEAIWAGDLSCGIWATALSISSLVIGSDRCPRFSFLGIRSLRFISI